jgi:hypothetical protein
MSGSTAGPLATKFQALQDQVNALLTEISMLKAATSTSTSSGSSTAGGTFVATTTTTSTVTYACTLWTLNSDDLLDYSSKAGISTYNQEVKPLEDKALADGFGMTSDQTIIFVEAFSRRAISMGWTKGTQQITQFTSKSGIAMDLIKCYGQIDKATLKRNVTTSVSLEEAGFSKG